MIRRVRVIDAQGTRHIEDYIDFSTKSGVERYMTGENWRGVDGDVFRKNHQLRVGTENGSSSVWVEV